MIDELAINGLGVIDEAVLELAPGFTAITGETGAGKTMVVSALGLLLGVKPRAAIVRAGAARAVVEGRFSVPADDDTIVERVHDAGGELDDGELILARTVSAEGRSRAHVGGRSAPVGVLSEIGERLVVIHGQSDQLRLQGERAQRHALDRFGGPAIASALADHRRLHERLIEASGQLLEITERRAEREAEAARLRAEVAEIEALAPRADEDVELRESIERLSNVDELRQAADFASSTISGEASEGIGAAPLTAQAIAAVERVAGDDRQLASVLTALRDAEAALGEAGMQLSTYRDDLEGASPAELDALNERLAELTALTRQHGGSLEAVLEHVATASARLMELDGDDERVDELTAEVKRLTREREAAAATLHELRVAAAQEISARVSEELRLLAMRDARIDVTVERAIEHRSHGADDIAFLLVPHQGAAAAPLGQGASGGELSRVMLALEVVLAESSPVPTMVFDEVDAGVGGSAAIEIGRRLAALARHTQVIVVTHLAQVAAFADRHVHVDKASSGGSTSSQVTVLDAEARVRETARLLSGLVESDSGLDHARELIALGARRD